MTLVELLIVIAIIVILMALVLAAVQSARETARMVQCSNNLRQIGQAALHHERAQGHFPSGGWGYLWVGDPDRGFGIGQPGGFFYNILPYLEQMPLHDMGVGLGNGTPTNAKGLIAAQMINVPLPVLNCPSRRPAQAFRFVSAASKMLNMGWPAGTTSSTCTRFDYAANGGGARVAWGVIPSNWPRNRIFDPSVTKDSTGLCHQQSVVTMADVLDGATLTYLVSEKYVPQDKYLTGQTRGDDQPGLSGDDLDVVRWGEPLPLRDPRTDANTSTNNQASGSCHTAGFGVVLCDGSVRRIDFTIDGATHRRLSNRKDGLIVRDSAL